MEHKRKVETMETITLWRPTGEQELKLVAQTGFTACPARLEEQSIFYPVLNHDYATKIARDWNAKYSGKGYVTKFEVKKSFFDNYEVHQVGGEPILEYWIPAEELNELNHNIVGKIEIVEEFFGE
jgi:hypothetical protein